MAEPQLPERFPIFPLPDVVLFPGAYLPLQIFEPRYRAMTRDALEGDGVIGMVLIKPGEDMMARRAPVFEVGCAGQIVESRKLPDGRYHLVLRGRLRFRILDEEQASSGYRCARASALPETPFETFEEPLQEEFNQRCEMLQQKMLELAQLTAPDNVADLRDRMRLLNPVLLTHAIAFGLDCLPLEKQSLLECDDPLLRLDTLLHLVELRTAAARLPSASSALN